MEALKRKPILDRSIELTMVNFYKMAVTDKSLNATHIAVFNALFFLLMEQKCNPVIINRKLIMKFSMIRSTATIHKCLWYLNNKQYITYLPSFDSRGKSVVVFYFETPENKIRGDL